MAEFFPGSLQDGISLAVREAKAVVCFVRDDTQTSSIWEEEYLKDDKTARTLANQAVLLRITAGTQEAGFLTSFCPITRFPAVVAIKNGTLQQCLVPEMSKKEFQTRLLSAVTDLEKPLETQSNVVTRDSSSVTTSIPNNTSPHFDHIVRPPPAQQKPHEDDNGEFTARNNQSVPTNSHSRPSLLKEIPKTQPIAKQEQTEKVQTKPTTCISSQDPARTSAGVGKKSPSPRGPPIQYRLQVRLFDGSSVRSSFAPTQTIRSDVRPWLDRLMGTEKKPYNLKHILNPLPSCMISVSEESLALEELGLGPTANLVMVPVSSYIDAYSTAGSSFPVRGMTAAYSLVSSAASTATGYVSSLMGYDLTRSNASGNDLSTSQPHPGHLGTPGAQSSRGHKPRIRTLRDREMDDKESQFYNGNQLNFEPQEGDGKTD